ncbi:MAG: AMP-binding protein [Bacteroidales bacterium]|nr:AMP-binding protein [Bacteroidales bacterium]
MKIQREQDYQELTTVTRFFEKCVERYPSNTLMMEKVHGTWNKWTYAEIKSEAYAFGAGLRLLGFEPGDRIALLSEGRKDWLVSELGMFYARLVNVPLSVKLDPSTEINFRLKHSGAKAVIVSQGQASKIADARIEETSVTNVINFDAEADNAPDVLSFKSICDKGNEWLKDEAHAAEMRAEVQKISPNDLANISYTSGTTSDPKGIMLTQRNYAANAMQSCTRVTLPETAVTLAILPWDHSFAHTVCLYCFMYYGAAVAAQETGRTQMETLRNIPKNIKEIRPTLMMSVPALSKAFKKNIESAVRAKGKTAWRMFSFFVSVAYKYNGNWSNRGKGWRFLLKPLMCLGDALIFNAVKANFGGRLANFIGGGALLDIELQRFFAAVGIPIMQGYGLSEASPVISTNALSAAKFGSSGMPIGFMDIKICDPDGNELPRGEKGEIVIKGDNVMSGYWDNPSASAECIKDGWLHTGDMGYIDADGFLFVLGRFKSLLIGSDGEKYSPEGVEESIVDLSDAIDQCMIYNNQSTFTVGVVVTNAAALKRHAQEAGVSLDTPEGIDFALRLIGSQISKFRRGGEFAGLHPERWTPAAVAVLPEAMTEANKMLNSTMKMVRSRVVEKYEATIESLFKAEMKDILNDANRAALKTFLGDVK